ncbi:tetratricopeptide repeat protein [Maridesulfovibrio sp.]|uniref:tetratricopeptide repeat protein n=1 Tax=Maridesulfovibrio sp. TaxID=2795000 RepID=UPI0029C9E28C|nr:tetratricopeptide repeat protein [Maridesulfovibrio sp.]
MKRFFVIIIASLLLMAQGCDKPADKSSEVLDKARADFISGFYADSEKGFERYLQDNPQGKERLEAWNCLIKIAAEVRHDSEQGIAILEAMYLEFGHNPKQGAKLKRQLAEMYIRTGQYRTAAEALEKSLEFPDQPQEQLDSTRSLLADTFRNLRNYDLAIYTYSDIVETTDNQKTKARAMFEMATTLTLIQAWDRAESELNELLGMENVPEEIHAEACFTLADIYEHRHEYKRAAELLQKIVDTYPNPNVVRYKLNYLQQK